MTFPFGEQELLGVAAREIHVCGDPSMAEIVTKIAQSCGDSVEIRVKLVEIRGNKIATASAECKVAGKLVSSAQLMFMLADATE